MPAICLILSLLGWALIMSAKPFDTGLIFVSTLFILVGFIYGIICLINQNYKKNFAIIGIAFCLISFAIKADLDNTRNNSLTYNSKTDIVPTTTSPQTSTPDTTSSQTSTPTTTKPQTSTPTTTKPQTSTPTTTKPQTSTPTTTKPQTSTPTTTRPQTSTPTTTRPQTTTLKNYEEIYDEYSKKLIEAGPTSSIREMAEITNEGIGKMAEYMYSAKGTDGQYATYEKWASKLQEIYLNNCR